MHEGHIFPVEYGSQRRRHLVLAQPQQGCSTAVDADHHLVRGSFDRVVDIDDVRRLLEDCAQFPGLVNLPPVVGTVHLRHQRRHDRGPRRHFNKPGVSAVFARNRLYLRPQRHRYFMALPLPLMLVYEVDLYIAKMIVLAQVVLTYEPVEAYRRRGAGIGLVVPDFRDAGQILTDIMQNAGRLFEAGAFRHVEHDLEL